VLFSLEHDVGVRQRLPSECLDHDLGLRGRNDPTHLQMFSPADVRALLAGFEGPKLHFVAGRLVPIQPRLFANDIVFAGRKPR
jgi:hypothetical protein